MLDRILLWLCTGRHNSGTGYFQLSEGLQRSSPARQRRGLWEATQLGRTNQPEDLTLYQTTSDITRSHARITWRSLQESPRAINGQKQQADTLATAVSPSQSCAGTRNILCYSFCSAKGRSLAVAFAGLLGSQAPMQYLSVICAECAQWPDAA